MKKPRTPSQVRAEFEAHGETVAEWCRRRGLQRMTVVDLLRGKRRGVRGEAHRAAVLLGLKPDPKTRRIHSPFNEEKEAA
ncbi:MAG: DNA-binding protein [Pseudomonadota bacterium]